MTPSFVIDTSVTMAWLFKDEFTPATQRLFDDLSAKQAIVPSWWYVEVANVLAVAERKGRVSLSQSAHFIVVLQSADIVEDDEASSRAFTH